MIVTLVLALLPALTGSITGNCDDIRVCVSAQNGDIQEISCCMHSPMDCRWISVGRAEANVSFREESGLILQWQPGRDPFGQYHCLNQLNETESSVLFLPENEHDSCPMCVSVEACSSSSSEISLIVSILFTESLIHTPCELHRSGELVRSIDLNACTMIGSFRREISSNVNYSVVCPICDDSQYSIHYSIPRSILIDAVGCSVQGMCIEPSPTQTSSLTELTQSVSHNTITMTSINFLSSSVMPSFTPAATKSDEGDENWIIGGAVGGAAFIIIVITVIVIIAWTFGKRQTRNSNTGGIVAVKNINGEPNVNIVSSGAVNSPLTDGGDNDQENTQSIDSVSTPAHQPSSKLSSNPATVEPKKEQTPLKVSKPQDKSIVDVIFSIYPDMEDNINTDELFAYLMPYNVLTRLEREHLGPKSFKTLLEKNRYLLGELEKKSPEGLENFMKALYASSHKNNGHQILIKKLQEKGVVVETITTGSYGTQV